MRVSSFINGVYVDSEEKRNITSPVTGELITPYSVATDAQVDEAVNAARAALKGEWGSMALQQRVDILYKIADGITARFDDFLEAECLDTGKPYSLARHIDIPRGAANFRIFADTIKNAADEAFHMPTPDGTGALNYTVRKPKGVIGVIGPWNLPLLLMTWKIGPALACGNTVVVKPSEETQLTMTLLGEVMNEAGVPKGVFNTVLGPGSRVGDKLITHPGLDAITFTGSTQTGERVAQAASVGLRDASLELGGKNPAIVFADCDLDKSIEGTMRSAFVNCGQVCLGTERVYVERSIFDEFVARLKAQAESLKFGRPEDSETTIGPLISATHREKVLRYYEQAVAEGATVITGGGIPDMPEELAGGNWIQPTIWTGLAEDATPIVEEIFGPCCHITPFDTEEEAVRMANDSPYGLASAVWTENASRAHRVGGQMEVGISWINSWFLRDLRTPFGGAKQSGIGREGGHYSLEFYTELTNVCIKL
ncbi:MAG: 2-hydroxymuconic semialdehyde dehydrogenase [Gammaproteobacteria bacterium]|nr:2-hydroxymuconic semialdehyde dehydrogenase [Gammaproteobacteria bacterium]